jgi:hypothetical protein
LWQEESFNGQMLQKNKPCKIKDSLWVDQSLAMVINNQEDISVLPKISISSKDTSCNIHEMRMVLSCTSKGGVQFLKLSYTLRGEYTNVVKMVSGKPKPPNQMNMVSGQPKTT